jgi:hypothetical protein
MTKKLSVVLALAMLLLATAPVQAKPNAARSTTIVAVEKNEYVVVSMENFPANETYYVRMNYNGTNGVNGILASKLATNSSDTSFYAKFPIPEELVNEDIINIRFENIEGEIDPAYNYFYNEDAAFNPSLYDYSDTEYNNLDVGDPQFTVLEVVYGSYMVVETKYVPEGERWAVYMKDGAMDATRLYEVNGFDAVEGGIYKMTLNIPDDLRYKEKIAVIFYCLGGDNYRFYNIVYNSDCAYPDICTMY